MIICSYLYFIDIEYRGKNYSPSEEISFSEDSILMLYVSSEDYDCESNEIFVSKKGGPSGWSIINEDTTPFSQECNSVYNRNNWKFVGYIDVYIPKDSTRTYRLHSDFPDDTMEFMTLDPVNPMRNPTTPPPLALLSDFMAGVFLFSLFAFRKLEMKSENDLM